MNKIIENYLDEYFSKKLIDKIKIDIAVFYVDQQVVFKDNQYFINVKPAKFHDKFYYNVFCFHKKDAFYLLMNYKELNLQKVLNNIKWEIF